MAEKPKNNPAPNPGPAPVRQEPVRAQTPPKEPDPTPAAIGDVIDQLRSQWIQIINDAPGGLSRTPAAALLRSGSKPLSIDGDTVIVSVKFPYHKEKMDILENRKTADKIVSNFLGRACTVQCIYEHENNHLVKAALERGAQVVDTEEA